MKRFRKALLALAALLGVLIVGGIWLVNSALNVASDMVDSTLDGARKVQAVAQREVTGASKDAQNNAKAAPPAAEPAPVAPEQPAPALVAKSSTVPSADKAPDAPADKDTNRAPKPSADKDQASEKDSLADIGDLLSLFMDDGEDVADLKGLLNSGDREARTDKATEGEKPAAKKSDDSLTDMIPGANSPTVKNWMAGKYKGKEAAALDDAMEDPKILRMIFFLAGGM